MLKIGEWLLGADSENIILYGKTMPRESDGEVEERDPDCPDGYEVYGCFNTVSGALRELANQGVRDTHLSDLHVVNAKIEALYQLIDELRISVPVGGD